jgi:hypothetical protein
MSVHSGAQSEQAHLCHQPLQSRPSRDELPVVRAVQARRDPRSRRLRGVGRGRGPHHARRVLQVGQGRGRPAQRGRRRRLYARERQRHHPHRLQGRVEEAVRGGLEGDLRRRGVRRRGRAPLAAGADRGAHLRRQHRVLDVRRAGLRRVRGHRPLRHARAARAALRAHDHRQVGRDHVPHRAAGRLRRRRRAHQGDQERRRHLQDPGHQDLHLRR